MCEIGKPIEIIDVEPLNHPAPLPRTKNEPERQPAVVPAAPVTETTLVEKRFSRARGAPCRTPDTAWT